MSWSYTASRGLASRLALTLTPLARCPGGRPPSKGRNVFQSETHMVFDSSSGGFHLVDSALVLTLARSQRPFRRSTRSSTSKPIGPILEMFVRSQMDDCSFAHTSLPLLASVRGKWRWGDAIAHSPALILSNKVGTPMAGEFPQSS
jgi:hypothetical protein